MSMSRILATAVAAAFSLVSVSPVLAQATPPTPPTPQTTPGSQPSDMSKTPEPSMSESGQKMKAKHDAKKKSVKKAAPKKSHETKEPASTEQGSGTTKQ